MSTKSAVEFPSINETRENNYELLRVIACYCVVLMHSSSHFQVPESIGQQNYMIAAFFSNLGRPAVPFFVMLSGAFTLKDKNCDYRRFYRNSFNKLAIPTLLFSLLYTLLYFFKAVIEGGDKIEPFINLLNGCPHVSMWFMYVLTGLYLFIPVLCSIKKTLTNKEYGVFSCVTIIISFLVVFCKCTLIWPIGFITWLSYYILGNVIYEQSSSIRKLLVPVQRRIISAFLIIIGLGGLIAYWYVDSYLPNRINDYSILGIPIIISSVCLFSAMSLCGNIAKNCFVEWISSNSLYIYLVHPLLIMGTGFLIRKVLLKDDYTAFTIPIIAFILMIISASLGELLKKLRGRLSKTINKEKGLTERGDAF